MSTVNPAAASGPSAAKLPREIAQPWLWLAGILVLALLVRGFHLTDSYQVEEFATVAAVAERAGLSPGMTATDEQQLVPLASAEQVRENSVAPFGIVDPVPLYHYVVWGVIQVLPPTDWSIRLPSLLAGVGCVLVLFLLVRRMLGTEVGLIAAALAAVEPVQVSVGWMARPHALACLAALLTFAALYKVLWAEKTATSVLAAVGYAAALAVLGYISPLMLLVVAAHLGIMAYALGTGAPGRAVLGVAAVAVGFALLFPVYGYWQENFDFARSHSEYLLAQQPIRIRTFLWHNMSLLMGLSLVFIAAAVIRWQVKGDDGSPAAEGDRVESGPDSTAVTTSPQRAAALAAPKAETAVASPQVAAALAEPKPNADLEEALPENDAALWTARLWIFLPQLAAIVLAYLTVQSIFQTRYLAFTTLGGALLLAYFATRDRSREVRLGTAAVVAFAFLAAGFLPDWFSGVGLFTNARAHELTKSMHDKLDERWQDGDVLLYRGGLLTADLLKSEIAPANRPAVERTLLAPLTTLYPDSQSRPVVLLSMSHYRNKDVPAGYGYLCMDQVAAYYDAELAKQLAGYKRYWLTGLPPVKGNATVHNMPFNTREYLACLLPWLADAVDSDLSLARNRTEERYVTVTTAIQPEDEVEGLTYGYRDDDFPYFVHAARRRPRSICMLGVLGLVGTPNSHMTVPALLGSQIPTPRHRVNPDNEAPATP